jgi:hypothetical protein
MHGADAEGLRQYAPGGDLIEKPNDLMGNEK